MMDRDVAECHARGLAEALESITRAHDAGRPLPIMELVRVKAVLRLAIEDLGELAAG